MLCIEQLSQTKYTHFTVDRPNYRLVSLESLGTVSSLSVID